MKEVRLSAKNGALRFIYDDKLRPLLNLGEGQVKRASHVEPTTDNKWSADMSPSGFNVVLGPFDTREEALREEVKFLQENMQKVTV